MVLESVELLDRQIEALSQMLVGLRAERDALEAHDIAALNTAMDAKTVCMARLEAIAAELDDLPRSEHPDVQARRETVHSLSTECCGLNAANGLKITGRQRFVTGALDALGVGPGLPVTYGPDGSNRQADAARKTLASV